jgi:hypothetical protein
MPQQAWRLGVLFAAGAVVLVGARSFLVPKTFGEKGHYRAAALKVIAAREPKYAGREQCYDCHTEVQKKMATAFHRGLGCEVCHGPAAVHASDPDSATSSPPVDRAFCTRCHGYDASRPTGFPQIDPALHDPLTLCTKCHDPHAPALPRSPQECSGCHGQIARTKITSRHVDLPCTTCHQGQTEQHRMSPRAVRPSKPAERSFCLRCHAPDAPQPKEVPATHDIPRVDVETHGGRFLCWQCHYPHYPEK